MKIELAVAAGLLVSAMPHVAEAGWRPLSQDAIETATFDGWQSAVQDANAVASAARQDDTAPTVRPIENATGVPAQDSDIAADPASAQAPASHIEDVAVTGEPGLTIASPAFSTDLPDQAGLETVDEPTQPDPFLIRLQILLDRAHASPGAIDGFDGENTRKAVAAYEAMRGLPEDGQVDPDLWVILSLDQGKATKTYTITQKDTEARFVGHIPDDYGELAKMEWLGYKSPVEMFAERFHMDEDLLLAMNPEADLMAVGTQILVADVGEAPVTKVAHIVVDKERGEPRCI
ncbi:peptidoglycan-binding domain-containing protein [Jiella pelagia]|uniref:Peptidoglycan-binding domain-containing protein n=1 Tax=Jiella pelagia TaxID=2986949 RepID=A0ABY7BWT8_9HYPH|nr:peptidoglycan-binding protein [Jiella pelagia]WAP67946.1 peptidoglycan-binding domain-containing protein [Jiella pelagia]